MLKKVSFSSLLVVLAVAGLIAVLTGVFGAEEARADFLIRQTSSNDTTSVGSQIVTNTLDVEGAATFDSTVNAAGALTASGTVHAVGAVTADSTLNVAGGVTCSGAVSAVSLTLTGDFIMPVTVQTVTNEQVVTLSPGGNVLRASGLPSGNTNNCTLSAVSAGAPFYIVNGSEETNLLAFAQSGYWKGAAVELAVDEMAVAFSSGTGSVHHVE